MASPTEPELLPLTDAEVRLWPRFVLPPDSARLLGALRDEVPFAQRSIRMFGREIAQPRLVSWHGDPGCSYTYSGLTLQPLPWAAALAELRDRIHETTGIAFNCVLANLYRDGRDSMGWHADDEPELGPRPALASVSFGATRRFDLRHRSRRDLATHSIPLVDGSLLLMTGSTQQHWQHRVLKTAQPCGERINLTFRRIGL